jgi:hypothetical protein
MRPLILTALPIIFTACSDASLKTFNADPTATINSHSDGDEILEKESYVLFGKVGDSDHAATDLTVNWYVDSDAACEDLTPEDDGYTSCEVTLGTGAMNILLEVSDPKNASGNDSVAITVNPSTPPDVNLISPYDGDRYRAEEPIEFRGYVMDEEEGIELEVWIESDIQGLLDITPALDADGDFSTYSTLIEGDHVITLSAQDSSGKVGEDSHLIEVLPANGAPSIDAVEITPDPATAEDALTCTYTGFSDPDGDEDASSYEWFINGETVGTGATLSSGYVRGDEVTCTVTPSDGDVDGDSLSDAIIIDNSQPSIDTVEITPAPATISDILTCTYTGFADADSDDDASSYAWTINGVDAGDSDTLEGGYVGGDEVTCTVTPSDGTDDGDPLSDTIIIDNTGPEVTSVEITPDSDITTSTTLSCNATATDPDGGTPSISYAWDIDGTSGGTGDSLDLSGTSAVSGQTVTCTATARDDAGDTALGTDSVLIENSAPAIDSITLSPTEVYTNDTITATVLSSDPEGDAVSLTYAWYVNSSLVSETGSTLDGVSYFDKHDEVDLVVTPSDGTETGDSMTSETITVLNTAPTAPEVEIVLGAGDHDGDGYFSVDDGGTDCNDEDASVHPRAGDTHGDGEDTDCDGIDCEAGYSDDGIYFTICTEETTQAEAHARCIDAGYDGLTVIHNAEQQTTVTALAEAISSSDDKELWLGITDAEEEGLWTDRTGLIPYTNWWPGQPAGATRENCAISPAYASYEWHDVACSRTHWISCSATVSFESAVSLTCSIDEESTDADGDPVTYDFAWDVDGESYTDTETTIWDDDTIPSDALGDDETWTCTVTPDDGEDNGDPGSDSYTTEDDGCWEASYDGSTYTFCTEPLTRVAAEADCADRDMDLVKITSDGENDFVYTQSVDVGHWGHPGPWIGLQDEDLDGTFEWNDGLSMTYTDWCPSHPISPGSRAYVHMEIASSDYPCWAANGSSSSAELQYVCE